jgi:DNA-binding Lrp family transcriptional regulator
MKSAFVLTQIGGLKSEDEVRGLHKALHDIDGVKTVHFVAGPTDIIAFAEAEDEAGLSAIIGKMRATHGVVSTDTRIVLTM